MTLKDRILERDRHDMVQKMLNVYVNSPEGKERSERYDKFLDVCDRLQNSVDLSNTECGTYQEVFDNIEKNNVDISDIIPKEKYEEFKRLMINDRIQCCPSIGKAPEKLRGLQGDDDETIDYMIKHHITTV